MGFSNDVGTYVTISFLCVCMCKSYKFRYKTRIRCGSVVRYTTWHTSTKAQTTIQMFSYYNLKRCTVRVHEKGLQYCTGQLFYNKTFPHAERGFPCQKPFHGKKIPPWNTSNNRKKHSCTIWQLIVFINVSNNLLIGFRIKCILDGCSQ